MQNRFDIRNAPIPPLRAEPRAEPRACAATAGHVQGVNVSSGGLIRATIGSAAAATAILAFFFLPAEYGIDPTGVGGLLGLTGMGEIKTQLAGEAAADAAMATAATAPAASIPADPAIALRLAAIEAQLAAIAAVIGADSLAASAPTAVVPEAPAVAAEPAPEPAAPAASGWRNEVSHTLVPGEGLEIKLVMQAGAMANFEWTATGGALNFETHGDDGADQSASYDEGRAVPEQTGTLTAAFTGNHGWFWRNRTEAPVTLTLRTAGDYSEMKVP